MSDTTQGGLVGAASNAARFVPSKHKLALALVFFAGVITIAKKAGADIPDYALWFGLSLGLAGLFAEMTAAGDIVRAWWNAKLGSMAGALAIWSFALAFSLSNWMGAASESQAEKSNAHKAAFVQSETVQKTVTDAAAKVAQERKAVETASKELWDAVPSIDGKSVTTPAEAEAVLQRLEADRFFKATDGCTQNVKGPKTRAFCATYAEAQSAAPKLEKRALMEETLAKREAALEKAEAAYTAAVTAQGSTKLEARTERSDLVLMTRWMGLEEQDAETFNALFAICAVSVFLSFFAGRDELAHLAAKSRRTPFNIGLKFRRWYERTMYGREPGDVKVVNNTTTITDRAFAGAVVRAHTSAYSGAAA
jgi:hypothetical protein